MADSVIARLVAEITGDASGLKSSVREAEGELGKVEKKAKKTGDATDSAFKRAGEGIEKSTEGVRKFIGALSSVAGIVTGAIGVIALFVGSLAKLENSFNDTRESVKQSNDTMRRFRRTLQDLDPAANPVDEIGRSFGDLKREVRDTLEPSKELADLLREIGAAEGRARKAAEDRAKSEARRSREQSRAAAGKSVEALRLALIDELEESEEVLERRRSERFRDEVTRLEFLGQLNVEQIEEVLSLEDERLKRNIDRINKEKNEQVKANQEAESQKRAEARETAKAYADAIRSELQGVTDDIFGSSGGFTTKLDTLVQELRRVRSDVQGLKQ